MTRNRVACIDRGPPRVNGGAGKLRGPTPGAEPRQLRAAEILAARTGPGRSPRGWFCWALTRHRHLIGVAPGKLLATNLPPVEQRLSSKIQSVEDGSKVRYVGGSKNDWIDGLIRQSQTQQVLDRDAVLESRQRRLTRKICPGRFESRKQLEDRIRAQRVVIVLVLDIHNDAEDPWAGHHRQRVEIDYPQCQKSIRIASRYQPHRVHKSSCDN